MSTSDSLFLSSGPSKLVKTSPIVLFSILDHFIRRGEGQQRVIGTLLGIVTDDVVEITNCFAVPHFEKDDEVAVGKDFNKQMYSLYSKVNDKEQVVGWYSTTVDGVAITDACCLIQEFYADECSDPVHLVLDTALSGDKLSARAFVTVALDSAEQALAAQFEEVALQVAAGADQSLAVHRMVLGQNEPWALEDANAKRPALQAPAALSGPLGGSEQATDALEGSLEALLQMLERCATYAEDVAAGRRTANHAIGRELSSALDAVPRMSGAALRPVVRGAAQDLLMSSYLAQLTRTQLALAERMTRSGI